MPPIMCEIMGVLVSLTIITLALLDMIPGSVRVYYKLKKHEK